MKTIELVLKVPEIDWSWLGLWNGYADISGIFIVCMAVSYIAFLTVKHRVEEEDMPEASEVIMSLPFVTISAMLWRLSDVTLVEKNKLENYREKAEKLDELYKGDWE